MFVRFARSGRLQDNFDGLLAAPAGTQVQFHRLVKLTSHDNMNGAHSVLVFRCANLNFAVGRVGANAKHRRRALNSNQVVPVGTLYRHVTGRGALLCVGGVLHDRVFAKGACQATLNGAGPLVRKPDLDRRCVFFDGLKPADALHVLESGVGLRRSLGCGLFVPHRSAAAVGA